MFVRTFFLQTLWNYERMQNVGFLFILKPILDKIYINKDEREKALLRHMGYFNTHPYMVGIIIAIIANLEKKIAKNNDKVLYDVNNIKSIMAGSLAALGDSFFAGMLRPAISFISILMVVFFEKDLDNRFANYGILVPLVFFVIYNVFHVCARYCFIFAAFKFDKKIILILSNLKFLLILVRCSGFVILIIATILYINNFAFMYVDSVLFNNIICNGLVYIMVFVFSLILSYRFCAIFLFYGIVVMCVLMSYLGI
jgi:PTS system mannose-specific IID component